LGGGRAFTGSPQLPKGWPSGLAVAPKVASAPRGPGFGNFAGYPVQSLPQSRLILQPIQFLLALYKAKHESQRQSTYLLRNFDKVSFDKHRFSHQHPGFSWQ
jgi:hypothetical protein